MVDIRTDLTVGMIEMMDLGVMEVVVMVWLPNVLIILCGRWRGARTFIFSLD